MTSNRAELDRRAAELGDLALKMRDSYIHVVAGMIHAGALVPPPGPIAEDYWSHGYGETTHLSQAEGALLHQMAAAHPTWSDPKQVDRGHPDTEVLMALASTISMRIEQVPHS